MNLTNYRPIVKYFNVSLTGSIQQLTVDDTIWSSKFLIQLSSQAAGVCYVGSDQDSPGTAPAALDDSNCICELMPGGTYEPPVRTIEDRGGAEFQLSHFWVLGPADKNLRVSYTTTGRAE